MISMLGAAVTLRKTAGLSLLICLLFCLPVGSSMAFLSASERVVEAAIPYPGAEDLYRLTQTHPDIPGGSGEFSAVQVELMRTALRSPETVVGYRVVTASFRTGGIAERVRLAIASPEYLTLVSGQPPPEPSRRSQGVWFSRDVWDRWFGELDPQEVPPFFIDDRPYDVFGLLPAVPLYPVDAGLLVLDDAFPGEKHDSRSFFVSALLKSDGTDEETWRAELDGLEERLAALAGITGARLAGYDVSARSLREDLAGDAFGLLAPLQLCALSLLILGAFNGWAVWSSFLAREKTGLATRMALGAEPLALRRRYLTLSAVTMLIAVAAGIWLATVLLPPLRNVLAPLSARHGEAELTARGVGLVGGSALILGVLSAALAWRTARITPGMALRPAGTGVASEPRAWESLVLVVQGTLCCTLVLSGIAASKRLQDRRADELGFEPSGVGIAGVSLPEPPYDSQEAVLSFVERVRESEGVAREHLAVATSAPLAGEFIHAWMIRVEVPGADLPLDTVIPTRLVTSNYFSIVGARFLRGEGFPDRISRELEVVPVVANRALVEDYWPQDPDPLGRRFFARGKTFRLVGVIENLRETTLHGEMEPMLYLPYSARPASELFLLWRERGRASLSAERLFRIVRSLEPQAVMFESSSLRRRYEDLLFLEIATSSLFGVMAIFALSMYCVGILAHLMQRARARAQSMAIRLAIGSPLSSVFWHFVAGSFTAVALGVSGGAVLYRFLAGLSFELDLLSVPPWQIALSVLVLALLVPVAGSLCLARLSLRDLRPYLEGNS